MRIVIGSVAAAFWLMAATGASAQQFYIGLQGGPNFAADSNLKQGGASGTLEYLPGGMLSLHAGYGFAFGLRLEGEFALRANEVDNLDGLDVDGTVSSAAFMTNLFYDFNTGTKFVPYVGAGIGFATVVADDIEAFGIPLVDDSDTKVAFQAGGGFAYKFTPHVALTSDLRFFGTSDLEFTDSSNTDFTATYFNTSWTVGVRFSF